MKISESQIRKIVMTILNEGAERYFFVKGSFNAILWKGKASSKNDAKKKAIDKGVDPSKIVAIDEKKDE